MVSEHATVALDRPILNRDLFHGGKPAADPDEITLICERPRDGQPLRFHFRTQNGREYDCGTSEYVYITDSAEDDLGRQVRELEQLVAPTYNAESLPSIRRKIENVGRDLYRQILPATLKTQLKRIPTGTVLNISSRVMWIPWEIFFDEIGFWATRFRVRRLPVLPADRLPESTDHVPIPILASGPIAYAAHVIGIGLTGEEYVLASDILSGVIAPDHVTVLRDPPATIDSLTEVAESVQLLHFTCHGILDDKNHYLGLVLVRVADLLPRASYVCRQTKRDAHREETLMITQFDDFCLWAYVVIDDIWQQISPLFTHPGPRSLCSDSELITLALIGECRGWNKETDLIQEWQAYRHLFPNLPERSRFNRRRRQLYQGINLVRQAILHVMDLGQDRQCLLDSLPVPVVKFHLVPGSTGDWKEHDARFGKVPSKKMTIFGYKLHLLLALNGTILDFELAPANATDLQVGTELLSAYTDLTVVGDKAYISAPAREDLKQREVHLLTIPRGNQKEQMPQQVKQLLNRMRQLIETVNGQLTEQFHIDINHAHSFWGLCTRLYSKLTAHTLCIYINRLLGKTRFLQIKALAFPN